MSALGRPEYELVLMIISNDPKEVIARISRLDSIGSYILKAKVKESIHDIYFDTPDRQLGRHRLNLRVRRTLEGRWITLKKSPGLFARNRNQRNETELEWSIESLARIIQEVGQNGVNVRTRGTDPGKSDQEDPISSLKGLGLEIIQDRETNREPKSVLSSNGETAAELAIDSVTYHFERRDVLLDEVEIEAKSKEEQHVVDDLADTLTRLIGPELKKWRSGKLSTGNKIDRLLKGGRLQSLMKDGRLTPEAYDLLLRA
ncbi:MAG TPA: CYTH domain-containing protein [Candidatus Binatus sp.]|nr:CYTH domain-containing protein [Candidatus Binatus sp.]